MLAENRKEMKVAGSLNVSHVSGKPLQWIDVTTPVIGHVVEVTFETITMSPICFLTEHGDLSVLSMVGKIMFYSKNWYSALSSDTFKSGKRLKHC